MRIPSSLRLILGTWVAALLGALAGRSLAEFSGPAHPGAEAVAAQVGIR
jgi:hypothetical protein